MRDGPSAKVMVLGWNAGWTLREGDGFGMGCGMDPPRG
jgi:hypothetical protein